MIAEVQRRKVEVRVRADPELELNGTRYRAVTFSFGDKKDVSLESQQSIGSNEPGSTIVFSEVLIGTTGSSSGTKPIGK